MIAVYLIIFVVSLLLIIYGGDFFVDSSINLAKRAKIPTIIIGATLVSIATTLPELTVTIIASAQKSYDLAVGDAVGSVICNTALICGLSMAIIPSALKEKTSPVKYILLIICAFLLLILGFGANNNFSISWYEALIFLSLFVVFMVFNLYDAKRQSAKNKNQENSTKSSNKSNKNSKQNSEIVNSQSTEKQQKLVITILLFLLGAGMISAGAYGMVESVKYLSARIGISESFIGLTVVAVGTSLPELITTITSIKKKNSELGYGNVIGANILNMTLLMGIPGLVSGSHGLTISYWTYLVSIPLVCVVTLLCVLPLMTKNKSYRWQGIVLLTLYALYLAFLITMSALGISV